MNDEYAQALRLETKTLSYGCDIGILLQHAHLMARHRRISVLSVYLWILRGTLGHIRH